MKLWKVFQPGSFRRPGFLSSTRSASGPASAGRSASLSKDDIRYGYRFVLGREPENEIVVAKHLSHKSFDDFRLTLLRSSEFQFIYKVMFQGSGDHPYISWARPAVAFIHLQKTGGTTLHSMLERCFLNDRICPIRDNNLHLLSVAELGQYDLFSGSFDCASIDFIPRRRVKTVAMFRNPQARLISFYRFHKAHPPRDEFAGSMFVCLANRLSAEEFFEHPEVRSTPEIYNHYLLSFGLSFAQVKLGWPPAGTEIWTQALDLAKQRVHALDGVGITECFDESVPLIFKSLDLPVPRSIKAVHVTEAFPELDARFSRVDPVPMTPRLADALKALTVFDDEIYREALAEFQRRRDASRRN